VTALQRHVTDTAAMEAFGAILARARPAGGVIWLRGELGAGKTTLARGFLFALGHVGPVRSPTYTLLEPYELATGPVYHLDLYRLTDPEELEYLGLRDLIEPQATFLVEWPERGGRQLLPADIEIELCYAGSARDAKCVAMTVCGEEWLARLTSAGGE